jgi:hypothetical protein
MIGTSGSSLKWIAWRPSHDGSRFTGARVGVAGISDQDRKQDLDLEACGRWQGFTVGIRMYTLSHGMTG